MSIGGRDFSLPPVCYALCLFHILYKPFKAFLRLLVYLRKISIELATGQKRYSLLSDFPCLRSAPVGTEQMSTGHLVPLFLPL